MKSHSNTRKNFSTALAPLVCGILALSLYASANPPPRMGQKPAPRPQPKPAPAPKIGQGKVQMDTSGARRGLTPDQAKAKELELKKRLTSAEQTHAETKPGPAHMYQTGGKH